MLDELSAFSSKCNRIDNKSIENWVVASILIAILIATQHNSFSYLKSVTSFILLLRWSKILG